MCGTSLQYFAVVKLPSNVLNMAAKYAKNMVGDETLLCPKVTLFIRLSSNSLYYDELFAIKFWILLQDLEELEKQHQSLSKVRQDLQAMAYERGIQR